MCCVELLSEEKNRLIFETKSYLENECMDGPPISPPTKQLEIEAKDVVGLWKKLDEGRKLTLSGPTRQAAVSKTRKISRVHTFSCENEDDTKSTKTISAESEDDTNSFSSSKGRTAHFLIPNLEPDSALVSE
jgi:hypothetical protein